jgi:SOS response regulatory protein OraA/RecX
VTDEPDLCYVAALRILKFRFNSEGELRRKLRGKKFEKAEIEATILRLHAEKWLDDERFAGAFVRTRANKRVGSQRIRRELQLLRKRARLLTLRHGAQYLATSVGRNKLAVYLLKQGYDAALVYEALKEIRVVDHQPDS